MNGSTSSEQVRHRPCRLHGVRLDDCAICAKSLPENSHECNFGCCQRVATVKRTYSRVSSGQVAEVRRFCESCLPLATQMDNGLKKFVSFTDEPLLMCWHTTYSTDARKMVRCGSERFNFVCRRGKVDRSGYVAVRTCLGCKTKTSEDVAPDVFHKIKTETEWRAWWLKIESREL